LKFNHVDVGIFLIKMYSLGNKIYFVTRNTIRELDIKFGGQQIYVYDIIHYMFNYKHLAVLTRLNIIVLFDGTNKREIKIHPISSIIEWNFYSVVNNMLIIRHSYGVYKIYDFDGNLIETRENNYDSIYFSPNCQKMLAVINCQHVVVPNFLNSSTRTVTNTHNLGQCPIYWRNEDELLKLYRYGPFLVKLEIIDSNANIIKIIDVSKFCFVWKYSQNCIGNIKIIDKTIYLWDDCKILVIDPFYNINCIDNMYQVCTYNTYHNAFIDNGMRLYKLSGNQLVRYNLVYDYWWDVEIPNYVNEIIQTLIELELFPHDIINVVYQQMYLRNYIINE